LDLIMSCWVYIIRSQLTGRYYCGYSDDVERRVRQHNDPEYRLTRTTKIWKGPWELVWKMPSSSRGEAVALERQIKKRGIGRYLKKVQVAESHPGGIRVRAGEPFDTKRALA
jgi:putative endonuclease